MPAKSGLKGRHHGRRKKGRKKRRNMRKIAKARKKR